MYLEISVINILHIDAALNCVLLCSGNLLYLSQYDGCAFVC